VQGGAQMPTFWRGVPSELEQQLIEAVPTLIDEANRWGDGETVDWLAVWLEEFRGICTPVSHCALLHHGPAFWGGEAGLWCTNGSLSPL